MLDSEGAIEARLARVERTNRWLVGVAAGSVALLLAAGASREEATVRARAFVVVDEAGRPRAELAVRDGHPALLLRDASGVERLLATDDADGTRVYLNDGDGTTRVGLAQFAHGGGGVACTVRAAGARRCST
jgi:hypothetical protein